MAVRTFIALELSEAAKAGILGCVEALRDRGVKASWARPSTIHLTLRFLGDVDDERLADVVSATERAAAVAQRFEFVTTGLGAFPSPARPRVVWAGVEAPDALYELRSALDVELESAGFARERRRFHPHVTLGRIRSSVGGLAELLSETPLPAETTRVAAVLVMKSTLAPSGAIHEIVSQVVLRERADSPYQD